jgi:5-methylcytosine-specific restriction endonuclease McrA
MKKHLSKEYFKYINSPRWYYKRKEALEFHGKKCKLCGSTQNLDVHHLTYERFGKEFMADLMILCRPCHNEEHSKYKVNSTPVLPKFVPKSFNKKTNRKLLREKRIKMLKINAVKNRVKAI